MADKFLEINSTKYETVYDFLKSVKTKEFGFDVLCKDNDCCCFGCESDIDGLLYKSLKRKMSKDVIKVKKFFSDIAKTEWYRITMNYENIDDARKRAGAKE